MASRSPGKNKTRRPTKAGSESGNRPKKKSGPASKGAGRSRATSKTAKPKARKKTRQKKVSFLARHQSYILGLSLGLVIGCLAAVLIIYAPEVIKKPLKAEAGRTKKTGTPAAESNDKSPSATQSKFPPQKIQYEEHQPLETLLKKLDQEIYIALHNMGVPDEDVHFLRITPQRLRNRYWDHLLIEVSPSAEVSVREIEARLKKVMEQSRLSPKPKISSVFGEGLVTAEIEYDGLKTHTVRLLAPGRAASARTEPASKTISVPVGPRPK